MIPLFADPGQLHCFSSPGGHNPITQLTPRRSTLTDAVLPGALPCTDTNGGAPGGVAPISSCAPDPGVLPSLVGCVWAASSATSAPPTGVAAAGPGPTMRSSNTD